MSCHWISFYSFYAFLRIGMMLELSHSLSCCRVLPWFDLCTTEATQETDNWFMQNESLERRVQGTHASPAPAQRQTLLAQSRSTGRFGSPWPSDYPSASTKTHILHHRLRTRGSQLERFHRLSSVPLFYVSVSINNSSEHGKYVLRDVSSYVLLHMKGRYIFKHCL